MCTPRVPRACGGQKRTTDTLGLELQTTVAAAWMLGIESRSSGSAPVAFTRALPLQPSVLLPSQAFSCRLFPSASLFLQYKPKKESVCSPDLGG